LKWGPDSVGPWGHSQITAERRQADAGVWAHQGAKELVVSFGEKSGSFLNSFLYQGTHTPIYQTLNDY
jgi:hypothetical protein